MNGNTEQASYQKQAYALVGDLLEQSVAELEKLANEYASFKPYLRHLLEARGKLIRPLISLLAGHLFKFGGADNSVVAKLAAAMECLHLATLVHDDIVDDAAVRRNRPTVSALWGDKVALLVGDYLFAAALELACASKINAIVSSTSRTVRDLSEGELRENLLVHNISKSQDEYIAIVGAKTASLFRSAAECGGLLGRAPQPDLQNLREYGLNLGIAFQIADDLLDYESTTPGAKKPTWNDLKEGTITLPLILALERGMEPRVLTNYFADKSDENAAEVKRQLFESGALQACRELAQTYTQKALANLKNLPDGEACAVLESIVVTVGAC